MAGGRQRGDRGARAHYDAIAARFEACPFYDITSDYNRRLLARVHEVTELGSGETLVDLGGGTGSFTAALVERSGCAGALVVEPSAGLAEQARVRPRIQVHVGDVDGWLASGSDPVSVVMMKEMVHHLDPGSFSSIFTGIRERLEPGGRILILTRPRALGLPVFPAARAVWAQDQPDPEPLVSALEAAGYRVDSREESIPLRLERPVWFQMIRDRFWSTFSRFSDDEIEEGIAAIQADHPGEGPIPMADDLILVLGRTRDTIRSGDPEVPQRRS